MGKDDKSAPRPPIVIDVGDRSALERKFLLSLLLAPPASRRRGNRPR